MYAENNEPNLRTELCTAPLMTIDTVNDGFGSRFKTTITGDIYVS
jgi:hypothetical protein